MRTYSRRSILASLGITLPFGLGARAGASPGLAGQAPALRFRPFEESLRAAFSASGRAKAPDSTPASPCARVEVGHSDLLRAGVQGCHNDRPFAGFPAGHLRIVRAGTEPGPAWQGVRLYVSTVDVALTGGLTAGDPSRPLDFATLPAATIVA